MKKETVKDWCKEWDVETIIGSAVQAGMQFMAEKSTSEDLQKYKKILVKELKSRMK